MANNIPRLRVVVSRNVFLLLVCFTLANSLNVQPIIGILTVPAEPQCITLAIEKGLNQHEVSCFHSYYVKWLESAGARVVPIRFNLAPAQLDPLLDSINGILFTGGELTLFPNTTYYKTANYIYKQVLERNSKQQYFPLWGTCMGFQLLNILTAENYTVLSHSMFDSEGMSLPLELTSDGMTSRLLKSMPTSLLDILTKDNVTANLHHDGVLPSTFYSTSKLTQFYDVVSTNVDRKGTPFVSTIEGKSTPVYGTQWHPERPQFEWKEGEDFNHTMGAISTMQYFANFFVSEARKNGNHFVNSTSERDALIYNYAPTFMGDSSQIYHFV